MKKRYHCEFKNCECKDFKKHCNNLCYNCKHSKIWHSSKSKPPTDSYLSFISPRFPARTPIYVKQHIKISIFMPFFPFIVNSLLWKNREIPLKEKGIIEKRI